MRRFRLASTLAILLTLLFLLPKPDTAQAQEYAYQEDFEDGQAQGWELEPGWEVLRVDGNSVLSGEGHRWSRSGKSYDDYRLSFRLMLIKNRVHLNFRMNNTGRYFIGFTAQGSDLNKQYWPDIFQENLAVGNIAHQENTWHRVEIIGDGNTLAFIVDGNTEWTYSDPEPLLVGSFAFETLDDSQVYLDDIRVELAPGSAYHVEDSVADLAWVRTGGPLGGLGYDIRMMPDNPDTLLVSDAFAGVFRSTDGGINWQPSNEGITVRTGGTGDAIPIFCLTIDPVNPDIVWAGTQNTRGIFKSMDGGLTWTRKDRGVVERDGITFRGFAVDPTNPNIVYAAAEISSWIWNQGRYAAGREFERVGGAVYKTTNGGEDWFATWRGDSLARYIWIDPRNTKVLYLSTGIFDREAANSDPEIGLPGGEGVLKSIDGGVNWFPINNGLNNLYVGSLFMHPSNPEILLAGTGNNQYFDHAGIYLSKDGGATWKQVFGDAIIEAVEFSVSDPEIAYAGSADAIYRSEDGGDSWRRVAGGGEDGWGAPGVRAGFPIDFQVDPRDPERIFANEYGGGNFLSEDGGQTWIDASRGYTGAQVRAIAVDPNQPGRVIAAARSGIFVSTNGGATWDGLSYYPVASMEWNAVAIDPVNPEHIIAETNWGNFLVNSRSGGRNWKQVHYLEGTRIGWNAIAFSPSNPNIVYAGSTGYFSAGSFDPSQPGAGINISRDGGDSWSAVNNALSTDASVFGLAVDAQNPEIVFAATSNHGLLKSEEGGGDWLTVQGGLPQSGAVSVAINTSNPLVILAGFERQALYKSMDGGETWKPSARGMNPEAKITSIIFDPTSDGEVVYAADYFNGVYRSANGGETWSAINTGLLMRSVNALAMSSDGLHLYAATEGGGIFRLDLNSKPPQSAPIPTASPTTPVPPLVVPTATPVGKPGICGSLVMLPLVAFGIAWQQVLRKKIKN